MSVTSAVQRFTIISANLTAVKLDHAPGPNPGLEYH
jgi:hypothetical protein